MEGTGERRGIVVLRLALALALAIIAVRVGVRVRARVRVKGTSFGLPSRYLAFAKVMAAAEMRFDQLQRDAEEGVVDEGAMQLTMERALAKMGKPASLVRGSSIHVASPSLPSPLFPLFSSLPCDHRTLCHLTLSLAQPHPTPSLPIAPHPTLAHSI